MSKIIDLNKSVYELYKLYPEIIETMKELGFEDISTPGMINTAGRFMTIQKGAKLKGIDISKIKEAFIQNGFKIIE